MGGVEVKLYRITLTHRWNKNETLYVVEESKEKALKIANERTKEGYTAEKAAYLADSLNYGNTMFHKESK